MLPVLFSVASFPITSFGLFLTLSILAGLYIIWRAAQIYEIDPERLLDIFFLTIFCSFLFARVYFVLFHQDLLVDPIKILLLNRYPGLSFWGGLLGGALALRFFAQRFKANLWQVLDFAAVGLFLGIFWGSIGCLLGSCGYGVSSNSAWAVSQAGVIGARLPIQAIEAILFFLGFLWLWKGLLRFHFAGSILARGLIFLGLIKFSLESWRGDIQKVPGSDLSFGFIWSVFCLIAGIRIYYLQSRRSIKADLSYILTLPVNSQHRKYVLSNFKRSCYNLLISWCFFLKNWRKNLLRLFNLKSNPTKF